MEILALYEEDVCRQSEAVSVLQDREDRYFLPEPLELRDGWHFMQPGELDSGEVKGARQTERGRLAKFRVFNRILASGHSGPVIGGRWVDEKRGNGEYRSRIVAQDFKRGRGDYLDDEGSFSKRWLHLRDRCLRIFSAPPPGVALPRCAMRVVRHGSNRARRRRRRLLRVLDNVDR